MAQCNRGDNSIDFFFHDFWMVWYIYDFFYWYDIFKNLNDPPGLGLAFVLEEPLSVPCLWWPGLWCCTPVCNPAGTVCCLVSVYPPNLNSTWPFHRPPQETGVSQLKAWLSWSLDKSDWLTIWFTCRYRWKHVASSPRGGARSSFWLSLSQIADRWIANLPFLHPPRLPLNISEPCKACIASLPPSLSCALYLKFWSKETAFDPRSQVFAATAMWLVTRNPVKKVHSSFSLPKCNLLWKWKNIPCCRTILANHVI